MLKNDRYVYKFVEKDGKYGLTEKAVFNPYTIERILGKVKIGRKCYEKIYVQDCYGIFFGTFLTERKNLTFDVVEHFVTSYSYGIRSVQNHPYTEDLFDDQLIDDVGMAVLTYKHFYSSQDCLADVY